MPRRRRLVPRDLGSLVVLGSILGFLFAPLVVVVMFSFNSDASLAFPMAGLSTRWYAQVFNDPQVLAAIGRSAAAAFATGLGAGALGILAGFGIQGLSGKVKDAVRSVVLLPLATPGLLLAIGLAIYYNRLGLRPPRLPMTVSGHILIALPFVLLTTTAALERFPTALLEAGRDLGASRARAFWTITFPIILPAVVGAILLAAAVSLDEFIIAFFTAGNDLTVPLVVFGRIQRVIDPSLNALATILLVSTTALALMGARTTAGTR